MYNPDIHLSNGSDLSLDKLSQIPITLLSERIRLIRDDEIRRQSLPLFCGSPTRPREGILDMSSNGILKSDIERIMRDPE